MSFAYCKLYGISFFVQPCDVACSCGLYMELSFFIELSRFDPNSVKSVFIIDLFDKSQVCVCNSIVINVLYFFAKRLVLFLLFDRL